MIISASRRTDIPRFHLSWFLNRLREGYVLVRNPMNREQVSCISLKREDVECIAFWTKDPRPLLAHLDDLADYPFFVQFTLNAYGADIEAGLPRKAELVDTFKRLSDAIGPERVIWRYSPVLLSDTYTVDHHREYFERFATRLEGSTDCCRISFLDIYPKLEELLAAHGITSVPKDSEASMAREFVSIGKAHGIEVGGCGGMDLQAASMARNACIDADTVARVTGRTVPHAPAPGKADGCYCMSSIDIGSYDTCANGCIYCYANKAGRAGSPARLHLSDPASPLLCDHLSTHDSVTLRETHSQTSPQLALGF